MTPNHLCDSVAVFPNGKHLNVPKIQLHAIFEFSVVCASAISYPKVFCISPPFSHSYYGNKVNFICKKVEGKLTLPLSHYLHTFWIPLIWCAWFFLFFCGRLHSKLNFLLGFCSGYGFIKMQKFSHSLQNNGGPFFLSMDKFCYSLSWYLGWGRGVGHH